MNCKNIESGTALIGLALSLCLAGCGGGTKLLKEPEPLVVTQSIATGSDGRVSANLDWVIVRDGPGTWAKNADWDEYLMRVQNAGDGSLSITNIVVFDSLGTRIEAGTNRKELVNGAKQAERRYKGQGLDVKAGAGSGTLMVAGAVTAASAMSVGAAAVFAGPALAGAAVGALVLAPVLAVGGVFRGVNNGRVNDQIEFRQTPMPVVLKNGEQATLDVFYPISPSPQRIEFTYVDAEGEHKLIVDTRTALDGLHLAQAAE